MADVEHQGVPHPRIGHLRRGAAAAEVLLAVLVLTLAAAVPAPAAKAVDVQSFTVGIPGVPLGFVGPLDPLLTLGDAGDEQLSFVTPLAVVPADALAKTAWMDLGKPGMDKEFLDFIWNAGSDRAATYILSYSVDGRAWLPAIGDGGFDLPDRTHGRTIAIRVWMTTSDANATPRFDDITIEWKKWTGKSTKPAGDGSGVSHKPDAGHNNGSGVYTYPSAEQAPAPTSAQSAGGTGAPAGASGGSSGGQGSGSGASVSAATASEPAPEAASATVASEVPAPPVQSTGEGVPTQVLGVVADQGQRVVTGVAYTPSTGLGSAGGGTAPGGATSGLSVPLLLIGSVAAVLGVTLFVPWLFTAASLRDLTGYNERRARARGPFGPVAR